MFFQHFCVSFLTTFLCSLKDKNASDSWITFTRKPFLLETELVAISSSSRFIANIQNVRGLLPSSWRQYRNLHLLKKSCKMHIRLKWDVIGLEAPHIWWPHYFKGAQVATTPAQSCLWFVLAWEYKFSHLTHGTGGLTHGASELLWNSVMFTREERQNSI